MKNIITLMIVVIGFGLNAQIFHENNTVGPTGSALGEKNSVKGDCNYSAAKVIIYFDSSINNYKQKFVNNSLLKTVRLYLYTLSLHL
jgi:hypothetical protein